MSDQMSDRLRVASIQTSIHFGGDENRLLQYLKAYDRTRFEHTAIVIMETNAESAAAGGSMSDRYAATGVPIVCLGETSFKTRRTLPVPLDLGRRAATFGRVVWRLAQVLRTRRIQVIDARLSLGTAIATAAAKLAGGIPVVATNYGIDAWASATRALPGQLTFANVDTIVCDSRRKLDEMITWARYAPRPAHVPNGIEVPKPTISRAEMTQILGFPADVPTIGQVARLVDYKGQRALIEAAPAIIAKVPDAHFVICGYAQRDDSYRCSLEARVLELGLGARVRVISYPGPIADVWTAIDVHAHPTLRDSSPLAILEAMAQGRTTVSTDVGGIAELIEDGVTGFVLPNGEPSLLLGTLASLLSDLLSDPERRRSMGAAARRRYERYHRPEQMARAMERLFVDAARRKEMR